MQKTRNHGVHHVSNLLDAMTICCSNRCSGHHFDYRCYFDISISKFGQNRCCHLLDGYWHTCTGCTSVHQSEGLLGRYPSVGQCRLTESAGQKQNYQYWQCSLHKCRNAVVEAVVVVSDDESRRRSYSKLRWTFHPVLL